MSEGCVSNVSSRMSNVLLGWPVRCVPELVSIGVVVGVKIVSAERSEVFETNGVARGEAVKHLRGAGARGPRVASARRGTGMSGRMGASMLDAIIPILKH